MDDTLKREQTHLSRFGKYQGKNTGHGPPESQTDHDSFNSVTNGMDPHEPSNSQKDKCNISGDRTNQILPLMLLQERLLTRPSVHQLLQQLATIEKYPLFCPSFPFYQQQRRHNLSVLHPVIFDSFFQSQVKDSSVMAEGVGRAASSLNSLELSEEEDTSDDGFERVGDDEIERAVYSGEGRMESEMTQTVESDLKTSEDDMDKSKITQLLTGVMQLIRLRDFEIFHLKSIILQLQKDFIELKSTMNGTMEREEQIQHDLDWVKNMMISEERNKLTNMEEMISKVLEKVDAHKTTTASPASVTTTTEDTDIRSLLTLYQQQLKLYEADFERERREKQLYLRERNAEYERRKRYENEVLTLHRQMDQHQNRQDSTYTLYKSHLKDTPSNTGVLNGIEHPTGVTNHEHAIANGTAVVQNGHSTVNKTTPRRRGRLELD